MKRRAVLVHLEKHGCHLLREGGNHSWWVNPYANRKTAIPRHTEIKNTLVKKICKDLGIPLL